MAKRKASTRGKSRGRTKRKSLWSQLFYSKLAWRLIFLATIVALLVWQRSALFSWAGDILRLFGWGLLLAVVAIAIVVGELWRRRLSPFIRHWNQWLGGVALLLAIWGALAFLPAEGILKPVSQGGRVGLGIIGYPDFNGLLRLLGLVITGIILVAPGASFHLVAKSISWVGKQLSRQPVPRPAQRQRLPFPPVTVTPRPPEIEPKKKAATPALAPTPSSPEIEPKKKAVTPVLAPTPSPQELKQVAQEVWKKYGESPALVTVDGWRLPPIDILDRSPEAEFGQADNVQRARLIEEALASYGVEAKVVQINAGPTVTQFGVEPGWDRKMKEVREKDRDGNVRVRLEEVSKTRVKVERITSLANDLALALAAPSIRIEAPVPGKSVVGIEVPNTISSLVNLRGVIETNAFQKIASRSKLAIALGKGAGGEAVVADLSRMPHLLIAGATGSGKTVCLNSIICCLLLHNTPNELRFIMIDPKRVELTPFNSIPHLATPVVVDINKALGTLRGLNQEMDRRYRELAKAGARNIEDYNRNKRGDEKHPYLVLIIDELADIMMAGLDEVEHILCRLAQLARATGIHLVVATQRPSVDVVTGLIKANFPTRISFAVTSQVDSRTILDTGGAEKLLGRGDMLYMPTEAAKPKRLQGCLVSDAEVERLVYFWSSQQRQEVARLKIDELAPSVAAGRGGYAEDPLLDTARQLAKEHKHISTSFLQRRLRIGYPRAARIMEQLEEEMDRGEEKSD